MRLPLTSAKAPGFRNKRRRDQNNNLQRFTDTEPGYCGWQTRAQLFEAGTVLRCGNSWNIRLPES